MSDYSTSVEPPNLLSTLNLSPLSKLVATSVVTAASLWTIWKVGNNVYQRYISGDTKVIGRSPTDQGREEAKVQQTEAADTKSPGRDRSPSVEFKPKAEEDHEDFQDVKTEAGDPAVEDSGDTPDASTAILASIALKDPLTVGETTGLEPTSAYSDSLRLQEIHVWERADHNPQLCPPG